MAHLHEVTDADVQFLIDKNKNITNETKLRELIQFDHNSERYTFRIPKTIEGHDMTTCNVIQIHYFNVDASTKAKNIGVYEVTDLKACEDDAEMLTFSWLISQNGTQFVGNIHFLVRFSCVNEGVVDYAWNTKIHTATKVGTGIYNSAEITEQYADVLEQWKKEVDALELIVDANTTAITNLYNNTASYYDSLSLAIDDINNDTKDNVVSDIPNARVKVFKNHLGITSVMFLDNVSEDTEIVVNKDIELSLNGYTLSFTTAAACLNCGADTSVVINGGTGSIVKTWDDVGTGTVCILKSAGVKVEINGGSYSIEGQAATIIVALNIATCAEAVINGITLNLNNTCESTTNGCRAMQASPICHLRNTTITATSVYTCVGIFTKYNGLYIDNCNITATGVNNASTYAFGTCIQIQSTGVVHVTDSKLLADSPNCTVDTSNYSVAIKNSGTLYCDNVELNGTHSGISNGGTLYINGGTYTGFCHGGVYIGSGSVGKEVYINDATIKSGNYEGIYDYSGLVDHIYGALYIGGSADAVGIIAHLDNCQIEQPYGNGYAIIMRGSDGEADNTLNISNTTLTNYYDGLIRIDNESLKLNVGMGGNIDANAIGSPNYAYFTDELYRRNPSEKKMHGNDYNALFEYISTIRSLLIDGDEVSY